MGDSKVGRRKAEMRNEEMIFLHDCANSSLVPRPRPAFRRWPLTPISTLHQWNHTFLAPKLLIVCRLFFFFLRCTITEKIVFVLLIAGHSVNFFDLLLSANL